MSAGDIGSLGSAIIAFIALLVSVVSMHKTNKFSSTADRLNRILIEKEQAEGLSSKKADISANLVKISKNDYRLKVFNRGKGVARNVQLVDLNSDESMLIASEIERKFPVPILDPHQSVDIIVAVFLSANPRAHIKIMWDDDTGSNHEKELTPIL